LKKKILFLNSTKNELHYGCDIVSDYIAKITAKKGYLLETFYLGFTLDDIKEKLEKKNYIHAIVNGEGTLHHSQKNALEIAKSLYFLNSNDIPFTIINATIQDNNPFVNSAISLAQKIYVRESFSERYLRNHNIISEVVPDLSFSYEIGPTLHSKINKILFSDSVVKETSNLIYRNLHKKGEFISLQHVNFQNQSIPLYSQYRKLLKLLSHINLKYLRKDIVGNESIGYCDSLEIFLKKIISSEIVISGRFHIICMCINAKVPFLAYGSNTYKIQGLINDIGISKSRFMSVNTMLNLESFSEYSFSKQELEKIEFYIANSKVKINRMFDQIFDSLNAL